VTNKGSNILEDLETLRLLAKVVPEYVESVDEEVSIAWKVDSPLEWRAACGGTAKVPDMHADRGLRPATAANAQGIEQAAFSLLFAFDEVISLGYKENVTVQQVKQVSGAASI